jgi:ATP-dependent DNA ligase
MLAKASDRFPSDPGWHFEPKWDGFRALVFRGRHETYLQSRQGRPLNRYFPELVAACERSIAVPMVLDAEIVIAGENGLDFDALQLRLHPARSRVARLARETPASLVAFDLLAIDGCDLRSAPQSLRFARLRRELADIAPPIYLTPATENIVIARDWFTRFEGAGLDGVVAKRSTDPYLPGQRVMVKLKHVRTADCVVGGFRWHRHGPGRLVGSLLLGLYDDDGTLCHVGVTSAFTTQERAALAQKLEPLRRNAERHHPWREWAQASQAQLPSAGSRWSGGKDLHWEPLRIERTCEVKYDHLQGRRFRHATTFVRWRPDKPPQACSFAQLDIAPPFELREIFGADNHAK